MKALVFFCFIICTVTLTFGQNRLSGEVKNQQTQQTIEFASIAIYSSVDRSLINGSISNTDGKFVVDKLPKGSFYAVVSFLGYQSRTIERIELSKNQKVNLGTIFLSPDLQYTVFYRWQSSNNRRFFL